MVRELRVYASALTEEQTKQVYDELQAKWSAPKDCHPDCEDLRCVCVCVCLHADQHQWQLRCMSAQKEQ